MTAELQGKRVLVFGSGKSGIAAAKLLCEAGAVPSVYDGNEKLKKEEIIGRLGTDAEVILGEWPAERTKEFDLMVISPGISCELPIVRAFQAEKIPVWGEIELAWRAGKGKVLAVTGTNGKTTTVSLLGEIIGAYFEETYVVGNIGIPYTDVALQQTEKAVTAAEISSFQLETIEEFHPIVSAITNITEDHLNRHHTMAEYIRVKERIAENQTAEDLCVLNYEDEVLRTFGENLHTKVMFFSSRRVLEEGIYLRGEQIEMNWQGEVIPVADIHELQLLGLHNYENIMTAVAMAFYAGVPMESIRKTIRAFRGVAHRIEYVTEIDGVRYYNDSKGTNPDAAIKGIEAMNRPTLLIGGGYDKESSYEDWINSFDGKVKYFALIGQTKEKIADAALRCGFPQEKIFFFEDLEQAVKACAEQAKPGDAVLLSPACASWGQFDNFEQRGDKFKEYVRQIERNDG